VVKLQTRYQFYFLKPWSDSESDEQAVKIDNIIQQSTGNAYYSRITHKLIHLVSWSF